MCEKCRKYWKAATIQFEIHFNFSLGMYYLLFMVLKLRIHWRLSTILKISNKSVWRKVFWYVEACIFWKLTEYTIHWDNTSVKKIYFRQNVQKIHTLFFLFQAPTHHSVTFDSQLLHKLNYEVHLYMTVQEFQFLFPSCF